MTYQITVCGNIATPDDEWQEWPTAHYQIELAEPDVGVAQELIKGMYLNKEATNLGIFNADLLISTIHPDWIPRCDGLDFADLEVDEEREIRLNPLPQTHTVCGWILETGQCYSDLWSAHGPKLAYAMAWHKMQDFGTLVLSCVHEGVWNRASWSPPYVDPSCSDDITMSTRLDGLIRGR